MHEGSITIRIRTDLQELERLNRVVRQFGELHEIPGRALYAMNLAIDELVTNALVYGYDDPKDREIVVRLDVSPNSLQARVTDDGREFDPRTAPVPKLDTNLEERQLGGLGIHLVRSLMDRLDYAREDGKNVLTVSKRIR